jgi:hypothetical protein
MGFNDKFALQKILNGPCPLWVLAVLKFRARAGFAGDRCCGVRDELQDHVQITARMVESFEFLPRPPRL